MGAPYQSQTVSGYNSSPPPDDGSTTAANKISWATIKSKITDPLNTAIAAINTALRSALNITPSTTGVNYTTVKADHLTTVEVSGTSTISLGDAASMVADSMGYAVTVKNKGTALVTANLASGASNTLDGVANGSITIPPWTSVTFSVNQAQTGYNILAASSPYRQGADVASASTVNLDTSSDGDYVNISGTTTITAITLQKGQEKTVKFAGILTLTNGASLILPGGASITTAAGDTAVFRGEASGVVRCIQYTKANGQPLGGAIPRSYLAGLTLSTAGGSTTMTVAAGQATDGGNSTVINLNSSIGKTTGAWTVGSGNGGLDTGSIANSTWYHFWLIQRTDTGVVDVLISLSATSPTMPANYTLKRRIGSGKTDGGGNWTAFTQDGDYFRWLASVLDVNTTNPGSTAVTATLGSVPTGVNVHALFNGESHNTGSGGSAAAYFSDLAAADEAPSRTATPIYSIGEAETAATGLVISTAAQLMIRTNTSAQIRYRLTFSDASCTLRIATLGWFDRRGRDA